MENKYVLRYGVFAGVVVASMLFLFVLLAETPLMSNYGETIGYASMVIAFSTIFFAVREFSKEKPTVGFKPAFLIGLKITIIATVIYTLAWFVLTNTIAQDFMEIHYQKGVEEIHNSDWPKAEKAARLERMKYFRELLKKPLVKIGVTISEIFPVGLLISLATALIFRKKQ